MRGLVNGNPPVGARSLDDGDEQGTGGPGGIRTHDSRIKSPELYR